MQLAWQRSRKALVFLLAIALGSIGITVFEPAEIAKADPACVNGGVDVIFARGSGEHLNDLRAHQFYLSLIGNAQHPGALYGKVPTAWVELGNEDGSVPVDMEHDPKGYGGNPPQPDAAHVYPFNEYPATTPVDPGGYGDSVKTGSNELVAHLNDRVSRCPQESIVLGGYSQGADVVGWVLQRSDLSQTVRNHVGYVALYGDPKFYAGPLSDRVNKVNFSTDWWWVRGNDAGYRHQWLSTANVPDNGILSPRLPYAPSQFYGRFGSWCASGDAMCAGFFPSGMDIHGGKYQDDPNNGQVCQGHTGWISCSASEIAYKAIQMRNNLNPSLLPATSGSYSPPNPSSGPVVDAPITVSAPTYPSSDGTRIALPSGAQYIWQRGVTLPVDYPDAVRYNNEGNSAVQTNWNGPMNTISLPPNTVVRPVGGNQQYLWSSGGQLLPIGDPATSACYLFSFPQSNPSGQPAIVPADWASALPTGNPGQCSLGDGIRFTQSDTGTQQYVSVRGAALPVSYGDAQAYDGEGDPYNPLTMPTGYVSSPIHASMPSYTVLRAAGQAQQYMWDGNQLHAIQDMGTSECFLLAYPQNGVALMPPSWVSGRTVGATAQCSLADGTRFTESAHSGLQQYVSVRGAALPVQTGDAQWYDNNGNGTVIDMANGYVENPIHTPTLPVNTVLRGTGSDAQYLWDGTQLHSVLYPSTSACLLLEHPQNGVAVVPASWEATLPIGANQSCAYEGHLLQSPSGSVDYIKNGSRHHVTNSAIVSCLKGRAGTGDPIVVDSATWNDYTSSGIDAYCPYETEPGLNFVQESGDSTVWLVGPGTGGGPGIKRHVGSLCVPDPYTTQLKQYHVWTVPAGETAGHVQGADFWASGPGCQGLPQG